MIQFLKNLFLKDLPLKLVSLGLAVTLWASVSTLIKKNERGQGEQMDSNKQFQGVPVSVVFPRGDATGFRTKPAQVTVFIQGTEQAITDLEPASVQAWVDLSYWDHRENLPLPVRVTSPAGTAWVSVSPEEVEILPPEPAPTPKSEPTKP